MRVEWTSRGTRGGLACGLGQILGGRASVAVQAGYDRYVDGIYPDSSTRGAFGLVLFKVASF